jgi:hypothetical protein
MGLFDRLFGTDDNYSPPARAGARSDDEIAVERYRYLLRTAPPETIEQVHAEAFSKLTQEQRDLLFRQLSDGAPTGEAPRDTTPAALASAATRQELRNPGTMERSLGGGGMGFGSMVASSLLGTVAGYVIGSALVSAFMPDLGASDGASSDSGSTDGSSSDSAGSDGSADSGADSGSDFGGDAGGDFGGGDFGGGFDF